MNSTMNASALSNIRKYYIVCSLSSSFGLLSIILSVMIVILVKRTKPRLHTVRHLLICNTCIASIIYCIAQTINYIIFIFFPWITSDEACRWRGYFGYLSLSAVTYSYLTQAISRLLFSVFATKHPWAVTFKVHYIFILIHWILIIILPSSSIITKDIYFRPGLLCWVPLKHFIHVVFTIVAFYLVPIMSILVIYIFIYKRVKSATKHAQLVRMATNDRRDLEVLRNIVILLFIYISGGIPTLIFIVTSSDILYLAGIVAVSLAMSIEKICTILLDRELRLVMKGILNSRNQVVSFENAINRTGDQKVTARFRRTLQKTLLVAEKSHDVRDEEIEKYEGDLGEVERLRKEYEDKLQNNGRNLSREENIFDK